MLLYDSVNKPAGLALSKAHKLLGSIIDKMIELGVESLYNHCDQAIHIVAQSENRTLMYIERQGYAYFVSHYQYETFDSDKGGLTTRPKLYSVMAHQYHSNNGFCVWNMFPAPVSDNIRHCESMIYGEHTEAYEADNINVNTINNTGFHFALTTGYGIDNWAIPIAPLGNYIAAHIDNFIFDLDGYKHIIKKSDISRIGDYKKAKPTYGIVTIDNNEYHKKWYIELTEILKLFPTGTFDLSSPEEYNINVTRYESVIKRILENSANCK